jgi:hypothetical protein
MAYELDIRAMQGLGNLPARLWLVATHGNGDGLLPIGDGVGMKTSSTGQVMARPIEQAARRPDLAARDNDAGSLAHAAILTGSV